jgi:outer membrane protein assembly factor BamB
MFAYAVPGVCLALVGGLVVTRRFRDSVRRAAMAAIILLAGGVWTLVRTEGISGDHVATFEWRWATSPEERLVTQTAHEPAMRPTASATRSATAPAGEPSAMRPHTESAALPTPSATSALVKSAPEWAGFRGPRRDGIVRGARIATDWASAPPAELWRRPVGPAWSSFAVRGNLVYTQEQRGDEELVTCYYAATGEPVWTHRDAARFFESNAGTGPRATPTLSNGRVYAFGATGILNALDAATGAPVWSRNTTADTGNHVPDWGFSSSPLVVDDVVIVAVGGQLAGYDAATGSPRWLGTSGGVSYSSPHLATIDGVVRVLFVSAAGAVSVAPADGTKLWEHKFRGFLPIVQPAVTAEGDVLIVGSADTGMRRVVVSRGNSGWIVEPRWTSLALKPYFNDFVVHRGYVFGFDGRILACIKLEDGTRVWKGGRYGNGQLVLLADQDLLLVLSEEGELALVRATPDQFTELARVPAIQGKTWNHPALIGDVLLIRNGEEMVAFRLPRGSR